MDDRRPADADPTASPEDAAKIMLDNGFRHVPIVEDGRAVGIVSIRDVARWSTEELFVPVCRRYSR